MIIMCKFRAAAGVGLAAGAAPSLYFDHRADGVKPLFLGDGTHATGDHIIIDMGCRAAGVAHQKNTVMDTAGMRIGNIGIGAFNAQGDIVRDEKIKDAVYAVRGDPPAPHFRNRIGDIVSGSGFFKFGKRIKNLRTHFGPLLACRNQRRFRGFGQVFAVVEDMIMTGHGKTIGVKPQSRKFAAPTGL